MTGLIEIDRRELSDLGTDVFRRLHEGVIFHVRDVDEIHVFLQHVDTQLRARGASEAADDVRAFLERGQPLSEDGAAALVTLLREIRDSRFLACLFSDLVAGFGLPTVSLSLLALTRPLPEARSQARRACVTAPWMA